jgi:uncharacterized membrane protein YgdD (TMEM256/DUF423 family)
MKKNLLVIASCLGAIGVISGALGAHFLEDKIDAEMMVVFEKSIRYLFIHIFITFVALIFYHLKQNRYFLISSILFITGIVLFSGSLMVYVVANWKMIDSMHWVVFLTPFGGLAFIIGWIILAIGFMKWEK